MRASVANGYTILEVMLFIAISGAMFILAMVSFSGRQQDVQFTQAVREFDAKIQDTINDVSTGFFPVDGRLSCTVSGPGRPVIDDAGTPLTQGTNNQCVLVGKAVQFAPNDGDGSTEDQSLLYTYNIVGRRQTFSGDATASLEEARPVAMAPRIANEFADVTEKAQLKYGLRVTKVAINDGTVAGSDTGTIGFFGGFSRSFGTTEFSDSQAVKVGAVSGTSVAQTQYQAVNAINTITDLNPPNAGDTYIDTSSTREIIICLTDANRRRKASITIGGNGRASTRVDFDTYNQAICGT